MVIINEYKVKLSSDLNPQPAKMLIVDRTNEKMVGEVNWYWKSEATNWAEIGIVIFNEQYWNKGIGTIVLPMWIDKIFLLLPEIVRIGITTWSGNPAMIKLAEKIGLYKEAEYKNARIFENKYYDSISYGIQKTEWHKLR